MAPSKNAGHVQFDPHDNMEYIVPTWNQSPIPTLSSSGASHSSRYFDEIALLKRGKITRETPKHTYRRFGGNIVPSIKPITMAELNSRGLRLDQDHVIYNIPESTMQATILHNVSPKMLNAATTSSRSSAFSVIKSPKKSREFVVGNPTENAKLRISSIAHKGKSYELSVDNDVCILQQSLKNVVLITWKN
ncbi:unnamed protein product [Cylicocyclus nassatus]|uniref:Uncharacterized protein n=1 Tax=Cylicocyclus nassatus TaxID=53992 RepID=A0AA36M9W9_CYLNA|nr:unnamed protein product [Cylicocyclus nassatus]